MVGVQDIYDYNHLELKTLKLAKSRIRKIKFQGRYRKLLLVSQMLLDPSFLFHASFLGGFVVITADMQYLPCAKWFT